ncbi:hypothetical protein BGZ73_009024 [Actinomortierella ambigua]|nr:hypothetical protein BGZ73_009024 [Actinomortierella ambigua]
MHFAQSYAVLWPAFLVPADTLLGSAKRKSGSTSGVLKLTGHYRVVMVACFFNSSRYSSGLCRVEKWSQQRPASIKRLAAAESDGPNGASRSPFVSASAHVALRRPRTPIGKAAKKYDGSSVELPEVPVDMEQEGTRRSVLYHIAASHLRNASVRQLHAQYDRSKCLDYKDAFVALSGIWDTFSSFTNELFGKDLTYEAKTLCYLPLIDNKDDELGEIANSLLQKQTLTAMLDETYKLQIDHPTYRRILNVLQIL